MICGNLIRWSLAIGNLSFNTLGCGIAMLHFLTPISNVKTAPRRYAETTD